MHHAALVVDLPGETLVVARWVLGVAIGLLVWLALSIDRVGFR